LPHWNEGTHHIHADNLLEKNRFKLLDIGIDEILVKVGGIWPLLILSAQTVVPHLVPHHLTLLPSSALVQIL